MDRAFSLQMVVALTSVGSCRVDDLGVRKKKLLLVVLEANKSEIKMSEDKKMSSLFYGLLITIFLSPPYMVDKDNIETAFLCLPLRTPIPSITSPSYDLIISKSPHLYMQ